jgi:histone H3/H4
MAKKGGKEVLVVTSKVKKFNKSKKFLTSSDSIQALNDKIYKLLEDAHTRTKANRRSTIKPQDF